MKNYYLTTTLPYVNADPHIGFALELIQADALVRYQRLLGHEVIFSTGTDEHGQKIYQKAVEAGIDPQEYCDAYAGKFDGLKMALDLSFDRFIRTTDEHHLAAAQEIWKRCDAKGDIYKKSYKGLYCVGDEMFVKDGDLVDGRCPNHPNDVPVEIEEENYFFRFSNYQNQLLEYLEQDGVIIPEWRRQEAIAFVKNGLEDFSISRSTERMPWGVPVPGDDTQVMYVWFDALTNYISTLGWPNTDEGTAFDEFWNNGKSVQVAGKDQVRFQSLMWQAMLMSAGEKGTDQIFYHGFITSDGQKMSKSLGNVIDPYEFVAKYGKGAVRFFLLGALPAYEDGDITNRRFEEYYTAHLSNGIGNLTSRVLAMLQKYSASRIPPVADDQFRTTDFWGAYQKAFEEYRFEDVVKTINELVAEMDGRISEEKPWEKAKRGEDVSQLLYALAEALRHLGIALLPIMPKQAGDILTSLGVNAENVESLDVEQQWGRLEPHVSIEKGEALFPRLDQRIKKS